MQKMPRTGIRLNLKFVKLFTLFVFVLMLTDTSKAFAQQDADLPTIDDIWRAWVVRELSIETLDCEWTETKFVPAKSHSAQEFPSLRSIRVPMTDLRFSNIGRMRLGTADRVRYDSQGKELINRIQSYAHRKQIFVSDRKQTRCYYGEDESGKQRYAPLGYIRKSEELFELLDHERGGGILFYCRPTAPEVQRLCSLKNAQVKGLAEVNGRKCVLAEKPNTYATTQIYFDLERDFVPVRLVYNSYDPDARKTFELSRFELEYEDAEQGPPRLTGWTGRSARGIDQPVYQETVTVTRLEINADVEDSAFELRFPAGTKVLDESSKDVYILRKDGSKRPVTRAERDALIPYKTLLNTEPRDHIPDEVNPRR